MICVAVAKIRKNLSLPFLTKEIFIFINAIFKQRHEQEMFYNLTDVQPTMLIIFHETSIILKNFGND